MRLFVSIVVVVPPLQPIWHQHNIKQATATAPQLQNSTWNTHIRSLLYSYGRRRNIIKAKLIIKTNYQICLQLLKTYLLHNWVNNKNANTLKNSYTVRLFWFRWCMCFRTNLLIEFVVEITSVLIFVISVEYFVSQPITRG